MRRLVAWIGGAVGGLAAYRLVRRHGAREPLPETTVTEPDDRAEELRAKLAETRAEEPAEGERPAAEPTEPAPTEPGPPESLDERRRRVHEEGRAAIDEMQSE